MTQPPQQPEHLLESLLSNTALPETPPVPADASTDEDVDTLIDELESLVADARRMPFHKLLVDEERLVQLVDRLRTAIPAEVRQAHQVLDEHDRILASARDQAQQMLEERGLLEAVEVQRRRMLDEADREATRIRTEADRYARGVLLELEERLAKFQTSVRNGIEALEGTETT